MSGICDTCKREHCHAKMDGLRSCDFYHGGETRYDRLFGTPERAARTLDGLNRCDADPVFSCDGCTVGDACVLRCFDYDMTLEWLRGDAE